MLGRATEGIGSETGRQAGWNAGSGDFPNTGVRVLFFGSEILKEINILH